MLALRKRLPLVVFLLLFLLLLMLVGFACACLTDFPMQAIDRVLTAFAALPAIVEVWARVAAAAFATTLLLATHSRAHGRASPAALQRFLF